MNISKRKSRVKGFTLVEMITVIAIIGILLGILTPAMMTYYRKSRLQAANADAKMVYNAAQTEVQKYINRDRMEGDATKRSGFAGKALISYRNDTGGEYAADPANALTAVDATATGQAAAHVIEAVNKMVSGAPEVYWGVYVDGYIIKASVSANMPNSRYIGCYTAHKTRAGAMSSDTYDNLYKGLLDGSQNMEEMTSSLVGTYDGSVVAPT